MKITNISKKQLKDALNNILEDLNANDRDFKSEDIRIVERFIQNIGSSSAEKIWKNLQKRKWLKSLIDDQLTNESPLFRENYQKNISPKKIKQAIEKVFIKTLLYEKENSKCQFLLKKG